MLHPDNLPGIAASAMLWTAFVRLVAVISRHNTITNTRRPTSRITSRITSRTSSRTTGLTTERANGRTDGRTNGRTITTTAIWTSGMSGGYCWWTSSVQPEVPTDSVDLPSDLRAEVPW